MGPGALSEVLATLRLPTHPNLLVGLDISDDAAVYAISEDTAMVQTLDFFPPIVDDPYTFGAIAAANALSDIYAMGGRPALALVIAAFPRDLPPSISSAILQGGADKVAEAGAVIGGGHTVIDQEPKYGLCVTGFVDPRRITRKANAHVGDVLLLTKPLGTGIITTAIKQRRGDTAHLEAAVASMLRLNRRAAELAAQGDIHSATDITGFGLAGHIAEIIRNSKVGVRIDAAALPMLPGAEAYAAANIVPGGLASNQAYLEQQGLMRYSQSLTEARQRLLFDPQTSGGLLFVLPPDAAVMFEQRCAAADQTCWRIGEVVMGQQITVD